MLQHEKQSWHPLIPLAYTTNLLYITYRRELQENPATFSSPSSSFLQGWLASAPQRSVNRRNGCYFFSATSCQDETVEDTKKSGRCQNMKARCQFGRIVGRNGCLLVSFISKSSKVIVCLLDRGKERETTHVRE